MQILLLLLILFMILITLVFLVLTKLIVSWYIPSDKCLPGIQVSRHTVMVDRGCWRPRTVHSGVTSDMICRTEKERERERDRERDRETERQRERQRQRQRQRKERT